MNIHIYIYIPNNMCVKSIVHSFVHVCRYMCIWLYVYIDACLYVCIFLLHLGNQNIFKQTEAQRDIQSIKIYESKYQTMTVRQFVSTVLLKVLIKMFGVSPIYIYNQRCTSVIPKCQTYVGFTSKNDLPQKTKTRLPRCLGVPNCQAGWSRWHGSRCGTRGNGWEIPKFMFLSYDLTLWLYFFMGW